MQWNRVRRGARRPGNFRLCRPSTGPDAGPAGPTSGHQPVQRSAARRLPVPLDRTGEHGRPHRRHRGLASDPNVIYIGYAVGGVFKSENNGMSFEPVFETYGSASIGDIAIHPTNPEHRLRRHGRAEQPADVVVRRRHLQDHRRRQDVHEHRAERDADDRAHRDRSEEPGRRSTSRRRATCSDRTPSAASSRRPTAARPGTRSSSSTRTPASPTSRIDPSNTNILYAASYQRRRSGCCFNGGGPGSALWKTDDAGKTWTKLTGNGLPPGHLRPHRARRLARRIPTSSTRRSKPVRPARPSGPIDSADAATEATPAGAAAVTPRSRCDHRRAWRGAAPAHRAGAGGGARGGGGGGGGRGSVRLVQQRRARRRLRTRRRRRRWRRRPAGAARDAAHAARARSVGRRRLPLREQGRRPGRSSATATRGRCTSASSASIRRTTRRSTSPACPSRSRSTAARPSPRSTKPAATASPAHVDQHAIWIDPKNPKHIMIGNDGGLDISWDQGKTWDFVEHDGDGARLRASPPTCGIPTTSTSGSRTTTAGAARARRAAAAAS